MEKFCDFITNPDWWGVILSAISTIAVIVIAVVQIRIQIKQNRLARYNENIELYNNIKKIHLSAQHIFMSINYTLENGYYQTYFKDEISKLKNLRRWFEENESDLRFRVKMNDMEYFSYTNILWRLEEIAYTMDDYICQEKVVINEESKSIGWILDDDTRIGSILSHIVNEKKSDIERLLLDTKSAKENMLKYSILNRLEELCTL